MKLSSFYLGTKIRKMIGRTYHHVTCKELYKILQNNWLAVQNLRIALKKAVFALGFKKPSVITRSYSKRVAGTNSFSRSSQRVMTEGFLKPNAKTAFFKAILKIMQLKLLFLLYYLLYFLSFGYILELRRHSK